MLRKALSESDVVVENEEELLDVIVSLARKRSVRELAVIIEEVLVDLMEEEG